MGIIDRYRNTPALVYTVGKVGSTAIESAVPGAIHTHSLYGRIPNGVRDPWRYDMLFGGLLAPLKGDARKWLQRHLLLWRDSPLKIVSLLREPVARNVSAFFQDLPLWMLVHTNEHLSDTRHEDPELLLKCFLAVYPHDHADRWMEHELLRFTGLSWADLEAVAEQEHCILQGRRSELFLGRMEDLDRINAPLGSFLGCRIPAEPANRASGKWYGPLQAEFMKALNATDYATTLRQRSRIHRLFYAGRQP